MQIWLLTQLERMRELQIGVVAIGFSGSGPRVGTARFRRCRVFTDAGATIPWLLSSRASAWASVTGMNVWNPPRPARSALTGMTGMNSSPARSAVTGMTGMAHGAERRGRFIHTMFIHT